MTTQEHLLTIVAEECNEVAHRASKAIRFTLSEIQPGQELNNADRIMEEFYDLMASIEECQKRNYLPIWNQEKIAIHISLKQQKIAKFLEYSKQVGSLSNI